MNTQQTPLPSLFEKIGGTAAVQAMVGQFYTQVTADPELAPFFRHVGMDKLEHMQAEFFTAALGGPLRYSGRPINHAHQGLRISRPQFQRFTEHLLTVLGESALSETDRYDIIARINTYADDIITGSAGCTE